MSKREEFNKKVITIKLVLILVVGIILGVSCIFSKQIENLLGIGDKESGFVSSEILQDSKLSVHYIDVGQGDSTLICLPDGKVMLIDAGTSKAGDYVVNYIKALEIDTIDYFVATHSDADHVGGAEKVFDAFQIKTVYRPFQISVKNGVPTQYEKLASYITDDTLDCNQATEGVYAEFLRCAYTETYSDGAETKNAEVWCSYDGIVIDSTLSAEEFSIEFFAPVRVQGYSAFDYAQTQTYGYPTKSYTSHSDNNASPIMLLEYNESSFMFTGDAAFDAEEDFLASLTTDEESRFNDIDVYQAGHHGSNTSNSQELLELITPTYVVVSCKNSAYGHPGEDFVERLKTLPHEVNDYLLITEKIGNIVFAFKDDGTLAYTALKAGDMQVTIYWWHIAVGAFLAISIIIICVKVTTNKKATAKRIVSTTKRVSKKFRAK